MKQFARISHIRVRFAFFKHTVHGLRFGTAGFGPRSENPTFLVALLELDIFHHAVFLSAV